MSAKETGGSEPINEWSRKVHDLLEQMSTRVFFEYRATDVWQPRVNVYSMHRQYCVCVEVAGLSPDAFAVHCLNESCIRISGRRVRPELPKQSGPCSMEVMEIDEGPFAREIDFPEPINMQRAEIIYDRGYLWILLPKSDTR